MRLDRPRAAARLALVAVGSALAGPLTAQTLDGSPPVEAFTRIDPETAPRPVLKALRKVAPLVIDGILDEQEWTKADSATDFTTALPRDGFPASERTVARVLYDADALYIGAYLYDSQPERLYSPGMEQDFPTHDADIFGVALDSYHDRQNGLVLILTPSGALFDAQSFNDSREVIDAWEGVVETRTAVHNDGWTVEMRIPLTTLRFRSSNGEQSWGLNFVRRIRRLNEDSYWAPLARQFRVHKMSRAGTLTGLNELDQGRNITFKPYTSLSGTGGALPRALGDDGGDLDAGFDAKLGLTSKLTLDLTMLTDFSQVEVDQEQVNLTRFSLFFPEKRDFFMENDGLFTLGDVAERNYRTGSSPRDFKLFYSRSIGLSRDRRPIPIVGGARVTGRAGTTEIGILDMQTRASGDSPAENFAVVRLRQPIGAGGDVGAMFINRQETDGSGAFNRSAGIDANLRLARYLILNGYAAGTDEPGVDGDRGSLFLQAAWRDRLWDVSAFVKHVGSDFNPDVGFIRRQGMRQAYATVGIHPQPGLPGIAEVNPYVELSLVETTTGTFDTRSAVAGFAASFLDGGMLTIQYEDRFERLADATDIAGASVPPGDYRFDGASAEYTTSGARLLSGSLEVAHGAFYNGRRTSIAGSALIRPDNHWSLEVIAQHNGLELTGQRVDADILGGRIRYAASTRLFTSAFVQYVRDTDELVTNVRLNYIHAPLSDVFLVLTERRNLAEDSLIERAVTLKVTKLLAF